MAAGGATSLSIVVMARDNAQPEWIRAGEELVRQVRNLVDDHGDVLERALAESLGNRDQAKDQIRQLDLFARSLAIELWRKDAPNRAIGGYVAAAVSAALAAFGLQIVNLAASDTYEAVTQARSQAETVAHECNVEVNVLRLDEGRLDETVLAETIDATVRVPEPTLGQPAQGNEREAATRPQRLSSFSEPF